MPCRRLAEIGKRHDGGGVCRHAASKPKTPCPLYAEICRVFKKREDGGGVACKTVSCLETPRHLRERARGFGMFFDRQAGKKDCPVLRLFTTLPPLWSQERTCRREGGSGLLPLMPGRPHDKDSRTPPILPKMLPAGWRSITLDDQQD